MGTAWRDASLVGAVLGVCGLGGCGPRAESSGPADGGATGEVGAPAEVLPPRPPIQSWESCGSLTLADNRLGGRPFVMGIAVSPDGTRMVDTTTYAAHAWRLAPRFEESALSWVYDESLELFPSFSRDGAHVAISGDGRELIDAATGTVVYAPDEPLSPTVPSLEDACWLWYLALSNQSRWAAGGNCQRGIQVFSVADHRLIAELPSGATNVGAAFSPDETLVATGVPELYRTSDWTRVWPPGVGVPAPPLPTPNGERVYDVTFTPDGKELVVTACNIPSAHDSRCETFVHSVETGSQVGTLPLRGARPSFSPDGDWIVSSDDVFNRATSRVVHLGDFTAAAFAPNGDIVAGTKDGVLTRFCAQR